MHSGVCISPLASLPCLGDVEGQQFTNRRRLTFNSFVSKESLVFLEENGTFET